MDWARFGLVGLGPDQMASPLHKLSRLPKCQKDLKACWHCARFWIRGLDHAERRYREIVQSMATTASLRLRYSNT